MLVGGAAIGAGIITRARAEEPIQFKLGTVDAPTSHSGIGSEAFAKEVATRSNGACRSLCSMPARWARFPDQMKNVFTGTQDMHLLYPGIPVQPAAGGEADLRAYLFRAQQHLQTYYKSALFKPAMDKLTALGSINLDPDWTWWIKDPRGLIATKPVMTPADLDGKKIRLWEDKTAIETWRGLGGNPS